MQLISSGGFLVSLVNKPYRIHGMHTRIQLIINVYIFHLIILDVFLHYMAHENVNENYQTRKYLWKSWSVHLFLILVKNYGDLKYTWSLSLVQFLWYYRKLRGHQKGHHVQCMPTETGAGQKLHPSDGVAGFI